MEHGHTLVELLIALAVIALCALLPTVSLIRHLERVETRSVSHMFQQVAMLAQTKAMYTRVPIDLACDGASVTASGGLAGGSTSQIPGTKTTVSSNVARWSRSSGVVVRFLPSFGSPDGAGSVYVGAPPNHMRVVVRLESGLTRLETP